MGSIVAGLVTWAVVVTVLNFVLRAAIPGYHSAETTLQFTMAMKIARLSEAAVTSVVAGAMTGLIAPTKRWAPLAVGLITLAMFLPEHVKLWDRFPVWYHLSFLVPLVPLVVLGGMLTQRARASGRTPAIAS
jgi:hypothetical protein